MKFLDSFKHKEGLNPQKENLLKKSSKEIEELKEYVYDNFLIEDLYIDESFYKNEQPFFNKLPIIFEMNYKSMCSLIDSKYLEKYENLNIFIHSNNETFNISKDNIKLINEEFHCDKKFKL